MILYGLASIGRWGLVSDLFDLTRQLRDPKIEIGLHLAGLQLVDFTDSHQHFFLFDTGGVVRLRGRAITYRVGVNGPEVQLEGLGFILEGLEVEGVVLDFVRAGLQRSEFVEANDVKLAHTLSNEDHFHVLVLWFLAEMIKDPSAESGQVLVSDMHFEGIHRESTAVL
jgi:hypothetical protein